MKNAKLPELPVCLTQVCHHQVFDETLDQLLELIREPNGTKIVFVIGVTGSGKTRLIEELCRRLLVIYAEEMMADPGMIPFAVTKVISPGPVAFNWKDTYIQLLKQLQHPFAGYRGLGKNGPVGDKDQGVGSGSNLSKWLSLSAAPLFRVLQDTIERRKTKTILLDEAHHALRLTSAQSLESQLDHLKFLADESPALFVLFATPSLLKMVDFSGQIIRRREVLDFRRYIYDPALESGGLEPFGEAVAHYAEGLEGHLEVDLLDEISYLFQGSIGCIGLLHQWLRRAWSRAKGRRITMDILNQTVKSLRGRKRILDEALQGEAYFQTKEGEESEFLTALGFTPENEEGNPAEKPKKRARPFKRKPHNDKVGMGRVDPAKQYAP